MVSCVSQPWRTRGALLSWRFAVVQDSPIGLEIKDLLKSAVLSVDVEGALCSESKLVGAPLTSQGLTTGVRTRAPVGI